jgi:acyl-coenzyme A synthetase/AMP-(fatty) acid ligase
MAETMKEAWSWALDSLRSYLETGKPIAVEAWEEAREAKGKPVKAKPKKRLRASA